MKVGSLHSTSINSPTNLSINLGVVLGAEHKTL